MYLEDPVAARRSNSSRRTAKCRIISISVHPTFAAHGILTPILTPLPVAPEICIQITPPSTCNEEIQERIHAYLVAGAKEVWIVQETGRIDYYDRDGKRTCTAFDIKVSLPDLEPVAPG